MKHGTYKVDSRTVIVNADRIDYVDHKVTVRIARMPGGAFSIPEDTPDDQLETVVRIYIAAREAFDAAQNQLQQYGQLN